METFDAAILAHDVFETVLPIFAQERSKNAEKTPAKSGIKQNGDNVKILTKLGNKRAGKSAEQAFNQYKTRSFGFVFTTATFG